MTDGSAASLGSLVRPLPNLERIIRGLLLIYVFALPFKGLLFIERNGFLILLFLLGVWCLVHRDHFFRRTALDIPLAAFVVWVGLTIPFATDPLYSLQEFGKLLQQGVIFYTVVYFFRARTDWERLIGLIIGTSSIISLYGLTQFDGTDQQSVTSFLPAEVWLTTYLVMLIPLCFALTWYEMTPWLKSLYAVSTMLATACLFLTQSRAGLVAFLAELWAFAWLLRKRALLIAAGVFTLAAVGGVALLLAVLTSPGGEERINASPIPLKTSTTSFVHRIDIGQFTLSKIAEYPVLGIGYGKETYKKLFGVVPEKDLLPGHSPVREAGTHNILLEMALHVGLPGLALFLWLAVRLGHTLIEGLRQSTDPHAKAFLLAACVGLIGLGVRLQFDQLLVGTLAIQFWVLMAVAIAVREVPFATDPSLPTLFQERGSTS